MGPNLSWAVAWAQEPAAWTRGTYLPSGGQTIPIHWKATNLKLIETTDGLRVEVEPKASGTADSVPLPLEPLCLYTLTMTCRHGPGLRLVVWVKWLEADRKPGARQMVWQLPDRYRVNWWPLSAHKTTYAQRFCLPRGATQVTLQIAMSGHPDAGHNYFELYDLTLVGGAKVPFGPNPICAGWSSSMKSNDAPSCFRCCVSWPIGQDVPRASSCSAAQRLIS